MIILPGLADGNDALNAFALGLIQLRTDNQLSTQTITRIIISTKINRYNQRFINAANEHDKLVYAQEVQQALADYLRRRLVLLLNKQIFSVVDNVKVINNDNQFLENLFSIFKQAFIKYYALKSKITFVEISNPLGLHPQATRFYREQLYQLFTKSASNLFEQLYDKLPLNAESQQQAEHIFQNLHKNYIDYWTNAVETYINAIEQNGIPIGELELRLLANNLGVQQIGICYDKIPEIGPFPLITLLCSSQSYWGLTQVTNGIINPLLDDYYKRIQYCYRFLDKVFDDGVFQLFHRNKTINELNDDYIPVLCKEKFFDEFRKNFPDKKSQLYGWRGLRNWIVEKDNEYKNKGRGWLDHTTIEFQILLNILSKLESIKFNIFTNYTSINRMFHIHLKKKYELFFKAILSNNNSFNLHFDLINSAHYLNIIHNIIPATSETDMIIQALSQIDKDLFMKKLKAGKKLFTKINNYGFIYYSQSDLIVKRNQYGQYLLQKENINNIFLTFNRSKDDKHFISRYVERHTWFKNAITTLTTDSPRFGVNLSTIPADISIYLKSNVPLTTAVPESNITSIFNFAYKRLYRDREAGKDTIVGSYYKYWTKLDTLLTIGLTLIITTIFINIFAKPPLNSISTAFLSVGGLFLGLYFSLSWKIIMQDLPAHDIEQARYRDGFAADIYRNNAINLIENKIERKVVKEIANEFQILENMPFPINPNIEERIKIRIREKTNEKFSLPVIKNKLENIIIEQFNSSTNKEPSLNDLLKNSGDDLYKSRLRRSYVKRELGLQVEKIIKKETIYRITRDFGFFKNNSCFLEVKEKKPQNPTECYRFDDIPNILN